jgi:signal peptidase I
MSGFVEAPIEPVTAEQAAMRDIVPESGEHGDDDQSVGDAMSVPPEQPADDEQSDSWWDLVRILIYALLIALVERTFFFQPYNIPSGSMEETLLVGDYVFVEKFSYGYSRYSIPWGRLLPSFGRWLPRDPQRGDVAVFTLPADPTRDFVKRIIGLPGDRIQMIDDVLYINSKPVPKVRVPDYVEDHNGYEHHVERYRETLPNGRSYYILNSDPTAPQRTTRIYVVPAGHYFMMGDNRDDSDDSRGIVDYLPAENLVGKAEFKFYSFDESKAHWWTFWRWPRAIRFGRIFTSVE